MPSIGPASTPSVIKGLIALTLTIAVIASLIQTVFSQFELFPGPYIILSLNSWGVNQGFLWQFFTYFFIYSFSITLSSLLSLLVDMYLLWVIGTDLVELRGKGAFLRFYLFTGAAAGAAAMLVTGSQTLLAGPGAPLLALLIAWAMAFPENEILLFFLLPIKAKWLVAGIAGAVLLLSLAEPNVPYFVLYLSACLAGYVYAAMNWRWQSPFPFTEKLDRFLASVGEKIRKKFSGSKAASQKNSKVIDIQTGQPLSKDEAFIEAMLAKISKYGENSLSWNEKRRMQQISEKMSRKK